MSASQGAIFAAWLTGEERPRVVLAEQDGTGWTRTSASGRRSSTQLLLGLTSTGGKATVLIVSTGGDRLYARSQP